MIGVASSEPPGNENELMMYFFVDRITVKGASGWVFSPEFTALRVQAWVNGGYLAESEVGSLRPDVAAAYGNAPRSLASGFTVCFPDLSKYQSDFHEITLVVVNDGDVKAVIAKALVLGAAGLSKAENAARVILANVAFHATSSRRRADHSQT